MAKFCSKCGTEMKEKENFCPNCGAGKANDVVGTPIITKRDIGIAILLTIVTCGFYSIYWFIVMTDESNTVSGDNTTSGGMAFLFTLLTCGIYGIYWYYKMGKKLYEAGQQHGKDIADNSLVYLLLAILVPGIGGTINYCMIQNDLNKFAE